ncbi:zinc ribbon domain-containing protein [Oryzomonas japonica]|uniref:Zinc ribbon domain-containing protein n=1 Tax=Oryzomonas japonica TaxID=2603858 RepID=A0A7J4ZMH1_9BACT|nr:zinc ribbon domain-containing protein [Oryzomonas japonica]KAB0663882.1 zinc ribbon domain-containing protein [Oryzomonas japonica]
MICPKCTHEQPDGSDHCLRCGVIFAKVHSAPQLVTVEVAATPTATLSGVTGPFKERLFAVEAEENRLLLAGRFCLWLGLAVWGVRFMTAPISGEFFNQSFMHLINLPFHEAGHLFFSPFGRFLQVLGGTLGQWIIPLVVTVAFLLKTDRFAASVGLWWLGQSFMDIAPYMDDARAGQLMLLGGVTGSEVADYHDWEIILTRLGWMRYDHLIARLSFGCGAVLMLAALLWGGWVLYRQKGAGVSRRS